ncbi:alkylhydroperoxidase [Paramagnetospirillum kuznetsovii]|uniref:Alkylhydroperoxidase n=1 Tax=Paramagnetospirillum kuznetsovii TaxID=2053833 RepID=A0A364NZU7_9PROT|nr:carboxymuconolactone decarboxylase family protein [Paramagnetospirillum kuznetsovii]RAU22586.1 alkylhydroperoxidase [Paramagnetospirillum kuznetsovii]
MDQRLDLTIVAPEGYKAMLGVHAYVQNSGISLGLLELVKMRVSQLNGCAFCIAMHVPLARKHGVTEDQLHLLAAWREAPIYSPKERAALDWAEALTHLCKGDVADDVYDEMRRHFTQKEVADLSFAVAEINAWNRLMICTRTPPQLGGSAA